jgi:hypothetical protein
MVAVMVEELLLSAGRLEALAERAIEPLLPGALPESESPPPPQESTNPQREMAITALINNLTQFLCFIFLPRPFFDCGMERQSRAI